MNHEWVPSTLGHGESMCKYCLITNREAAVLGQLNHCENRNKEKSVLRIVEQKESE